MVLDIEEKNNEPAKAQESRSDFGLIKETTALSFPQDVIMASQKHFVLVDVWSPRCQPCLQLTPILEKWVKKLHQEKSGILTLVKLNSDQYPHILAQLGLRSLPAVIVFRNGMPVDGFMGALPEKQVVTFLERLTGLSLETDPVGDLLKRAEDLTTQGDFAGAAEIYARVLQAQPAHPVALLALIQIYMNLKEYTLARSFMDMVAPEILKNDPPLQAAKKTLELIEQTESLSGSAVEFEARLKANPKDWEACFDLALLYNGVGKRTQALDLLLDIIRHDRQWRDDGARKQLLELFDVWGPEAPETQAGRRKLSALLFS